MNDWTSAGRSSRTMAFTKVMISNLGEGQHHWRTIGYPVKVMMTSALLQTDGKAAMDWNRLTIEMVGRLLKPEMPRKRSRK